MSCVTYNNGVYSLNGFFFREEEFDFPDEDPVEDGEYICRPDSFYIVRNTPVLSLQETEDVLTKAVAKLIIDRSLYGFTEVNKDDIQDLVGLWMEHDSLKGTIIFPLLNEEYDDDDDEDEAVEAYSYVLNNIMSKF
jgi:hypothetical protein